MMDYNQYIDHTQLKQDATLNQINTLIEEAKQYNFKSVCVQPSYVAHSRKALQDSEVLVCTVVGFPLGQNTTETKVFETVQAIKDGADEIDMVINVAKLKDELYDEVQLDIQSVVSAAHKESKIVKVILETCLLSDDEIKKACEISEKAGADFVKTSTGFSTGGATVEAVQLMKQTVGDRLEVKASGGVRSLKDMNKMIEAGATRIGASSGVKIMQGLESDSDY